MFQMLFNVFSSDWFSLQTTNMLTSLSLDKEVALIAKHNFSPVFFCPAFMLQCPGVPLLFHHVGQQLLLHRSSGELVTVEQPPPDRGGTDVHAGLT